MPVDFLEHQHDSYGRYCQPPTPQDLSRCFHLDDLDLELISEKRGAHNRLGFALQLSTLRYLGLFIKQPFDVPDIVLETLAEQLNLNEKVDYQRYLEGSQRWYHVQQIREHYGYTDLSEGRIVFYFCRWLYALCWSGIDRPKVLFEKAQYWLIAHKVILPGRSTRSTNPQGRQCWRPFLQLADTKNASHWEAFFLRSFISLEKDR